MTRNNLEAQLKAQLATMTKTSPNDWFLVTKARFGMQVVFEAIAQVRSVGEIVTQPFTCATAVNPILEAGHTPIYAEASPKTFSIDPTTLPDSQNVRAVVVQHTFGIQADTAAVRDFADQHGTVVVEDSAHSVGLLSRNEQGKPLADVSVHSFGVEKMLPTKFGGAVWVNPELEEELRSELRRRFETLPVISGLASARTHWYRNQQRIFNRLPVGLSKLFSSILTTVGLYEPAIHPRELEGRNWGKPAKPSNWMVKQALYALQNLPENNRQRSEATKYYFDNLPSSVVSVQPSNTPLVRFPILAKSDKLAVELFTTLRKHGIYSGKWYRPTLFPGVKPETYSYNREKCPIAEDLSARIVNLPTKISLEEAKEIVDVLRSQTI